MTKIILSFLLLLLVFTFGATAAEKEAKSGGVVSTGIKDQAGVAVTIYNANLALVKDLRKIKLLRGFGDLRFMDVASQIIPASVHIKSLTDPDGLQVIEQNYEYDLLNSQKLTDKYIGRDVKLYQKNPYTEKEEVLTATVLSNNGGPIFKIGGDITFGHPGRIIFPGVPEDLISKPTLVWLITNSGPSVHDIEASYLTAGINWRADYVVTLNHNDDRADLSSWVTIDNKSGTAYRDARLKLVAGDVHRVREEREYMDRMPRLQSMAAPTAPQFKEESFFEYHIYTLHRTSTLKDNQTKQISLITADDIPVKKEFIYQGARQYYYSQYGEPVTNQKVGVFVELENRKANNLGIPLPKGIVRVYKKDNEGSLQFAGEDRIDHTPEDEKIRLKLGDAFDIKASRKQTDWKKTAFDTYEAEFEISLRNHKKEDIVVKVVEPIPGEWKMLASSHDYIKSAAFTAEFSIPVPKDKEMKLNYRVRMRY